jgi:hypothetical protein
MDVKAILLNLMSSAIWACIGAILLRGVFRYRIVRPGHNLWQMKNPKELVIVASASSSTHTGEYIRRTTGVGDLRALAPIVSSLTRSYGKLTIRNIFLASDQLQERLENDILLIGGPRTNAVSADLLTLADGCQPIKYRDNKLCWRTLRDGRWSDEDCQAYDGEITNDTVIRDFGFIIRMENPFTTNKSTLVFFAGCHTPGITAAARYFTETLSQGFSFRKIRDSNFAVLVSANIRNDYPIHIRLERSFFWAKENVRQINPSFK